MLNYNVHLDLRTFFNSFLERPDVQERPLPHSSRCAERIYEAANKLVSWTINSHPVLEVRKSAFRDQVMLPAPDGDARPNPDDDLAGLHIKVFEHREDEEIPRIAFFAQKYVEKFPERTVAVLVPTNDFGHKIAEIFDREEASYDNLLRGGTREREIAGGLHGALALLAEPSKRANISNLWDSMFKLEHPFADVEDERADHLTTLLNSVILPESLFYPTGRSVDGMLEALPQGVTKEEDLTDIARYVQFAQKIFDLAHLPIDDLIISVADELLAWHESESNETDLAIAYQIANQVRAWADLNPEWRLPILTFFDSEHIFQKEQLLDMERTESYLPRFNGILNINHRWLHFFITGTKPKLEHSITFPAQKISTNLDWEDMVLNPSIMEIILS